MYISIYVRMYVCMCVCVYVCMCVCVYVCNKMGKCPIGIALICLFTYLRTNLVIDGF